MAGVRTIEMGLRLGLLEEMAKHPQGLTAEALAKTTGMDPLYVQIWDLPWTVTALNRELRVWERIYNTVRPHQALGYRTPQQFLREFARANTG